MHPPDSDEAKAAHSIGLEDNLATWMRQMAIWASIGLAFFAFLNRTRDEMTDFRRLELLAMHAVPLLLLTIGIITGSQAVASYIQRARTFGVSVTVSYVISSITWILILVGIIIVATNNLVKLYREREARARVAI